MLQYAHAHAAGVTVKDADGVHFISFRPRQRAPRDARDRNAVRTWVGEMPQMARAASHLNNSVLPPTINFLTLLPRGRRMPNPAAR